MATLLPNSKPLSSHFIPDSRSLLLHFSRFTLRNGEKLFWASSISSCRWKESCITFTSQRRRTAFMSDTFVPDDNKEDWDNEEEEEEEDEEEGEDGGESIPLREMTQWLQNKPSGFGEGKRYDTTVEDKLLEEIEKTRKDQLEEKKKPRVISKENAGSVQKQEKQNVSEVIKSDTEVRVWNLPKKKNIDRDLWKVFKGFPGIITISPAVTGNRKTRDPICRGFAFVGFESDDAAYRFVHKYSNQNLLFGKVQKKISCDVVNVHGVLNSPDSSRGSGTSSNTSERRDSGNEISMSYVLDISESTNGIPLVESKEEFSMLPNNINISLSNNKAAVMAFEHSSSTYPGFVEGENEVNEDPQSITPMSSCQNREKTVKMDKTKPAKSSKPHVLGSLARLKIKDRAVLSGVFSKYGEGISPASNET